MKTYRPHIHIILLDSGLGNQMFCYAYYLSVKKNTPFSIFLLDSNSHIYGHYGLEIFKELHCRGQWRWYLFRLLKKTIPHFLEYFEIIKQKNALTYETTDSSFITKNTYHIGFHQSEKYFISIEKIIRRHFRFRKNKISEHSKRIVAELKSCNSIAVHIRRGDYLEQFAENMCSLDYYKKAFDYIDQKVDTPQYYFFSDDIKWCKETFGIQDNYHLIDFNQGSDSWQDMYLMTNCKHNIIANSSFSWWGAWLNNNKDKIVVAPNPWFRTWSKDSSFDAIPDSWVKIDNI